MRKMEVLRIPLPDLNGKTSSRSVKAYVRAMTLYLCLKNKTAEIEAEAIVARGRLTGRMMREAEQILRNLKGETEL